MIAPLRARHRRMTGALAVLLPVGFAAGLAVRAPMPATEKLPAETRTVVPKGAKDLGFLDIFYDFSTSYMMGRAWRVPDAAGGRTLLELTVYREFESPDVLLYWTPEVLEGEDIPLSKPDLPVGAILLGKFSALGEQVFVLPEAARNGGGYLHAYSLSTGEVLEDSFLPSFGS